MSEEDRAALEINAMDAVLLDSLRLVMRTVKTDSSRRVRRSAAMSLLCSLQDVESPLAYQSVSLGEQLNTFTWCDPSGLVVLPPAMVTNIAATTSQSSDLSASGNRRYHEEYRHHLSRVTDSKALGAVLGEWWQLMDSGIRCAGDQVNTCSKISYLCLFFKHLTVFFSIYLFSFSCHHLCFFCYRFSASRFGQRGLFSSFKRQLPHSTTPTTTFRSAYLMQKMGVEEIWMMLIYTLKIFESCASPLMIPPRNHLLVMCFPWEGQESGQHRRMGMC